MNKEFIKEVCRNIIPATLFALVLYMLIVLAATCQSVRAQNVVQNGNTFVQVVDSSKTIVKGSFSLTKYTYQTSDGTKYPIYMSSNGKCFIFRTSKQGKQYRQYLPVITKKISKK